MSGLFGLGRARGSGSRRSGLPGLLLAFMATGGGAMSGVAHAQTTLSIADSSIAEGNSGTRNLEFTVTRGGDTSGASSVSVATQDGTATSPGDYSFLPNLARGASATQSSTSFDGVAARAVDGNTDGNYENDSVTHTEGDGMGETEPFLEIDLGGVQNLDTVRIFNRTDCCGERLEGFHLLLSDTPFVGRTLSELNAQTTGIFDSGAQTSSGTGINTLSPARTARYLRIQLEGNDKILSIAELQAFSLPGTPFTVNFAANETTKIVSVAVNGDEQAEEDETFTVNLSNEMGATIEDGTATGIIIDDDTVRAVNTLSDEVVAGDGETSLREAIIQANSNPDASVITFDPDLFDDDMRSEIEVSDIDNNLSGSAFDLTTEITITGPGADKLAVRSADGAVSRLFFINGGATVSISGLSLENGVANGDDGGGINNEGTLTVSDCRFEGNTAGFGGAIYTVGTLLVERSLFEGNGAGLGGGIYSATRSFSSGAPDPGETVQIRNSTFVNNEAASAAGGVYNVNGLTILDSCTIAGNTAPGNAGGGLRSFNDAPTQTRVNNSIIVGNEGEDLATDRSTTPFDSQGFNIIGFGAGVADFDEETDTTEVSLENSGLSLDENDAVNLRDNGGTMESVSLVPNSIAVDQGNTTLVKDGRNFLRPVDFSAIANETGGNGADIGAFERQNGAPVASPVESFSTPQNVAKTITLAGTDADSDTLSIVITSLPTLGTLFDGADTTTPITTVGYVLTDTQNRVTLRSPTAGTGSFTFAVNDGTVNSEAETVNYTITDTQAPTIAITTPANGTIVNTLTPISGTASDNVAVTRVGLFLKRQNDGKFWNGTQWIVYTPAIAELTTTLTATENGVSWTRASGLPSGPDLTSGPYQITARAFDAQNNATSAVSNVNVDVSLPVVSIQSPVDNGSYNTTPVFNGNAVDTKGDSGIARVELMLRRNGVGDFWNGTNWAGKTPVTFSTTLGGNITGNTWRRDGALPVVNTQNPSMKLTDGSYTTTAIAIDRAGNRTQTTSNFFVDTVKPLVAITTPANGTRTNSLPRIDGTTSDNAAGVVRVDVFLRRDRDSAFWNGTAFAPLSSASALTTTLGGAPGNRTWSRIGGLPSSNQLEPTTYQITARSTDRAGNVAVALSNITVPRQTTTGQTAAASPVALSSASAKSDGTIKLTFTGALGAGATDATNYSVAQNGAAVEVASVQQPSSSEVVLSLDGLTSGARIAVTYDLKDAQGRTISGTATVSVK